MTLTLLWLFGCFSMFIYAARRLDAFFFWCSIAWFVVIAFDIEYMQLIPFLLGATTASLLLVTIFVWLAKEFFKGNN